jgi:hypothetical protein
MGLEFLKRVQQATAVVGALAFVLVSVYHDTNFALGILVGCAWGIGNFYALTLVLTAVLRPDTINKQRAYILAAIKFPLLYVIGFFILRSGWFEPVSLIVGFSLLFLVILLKAAGRAFLHLDDRPSEKNNNPGHPAESHT